MRTLLPLIASGALLSAVLVGCESKNPVGPGEVTVVSATTTTTSVVPARRYIAFNPVPTAPSDMTLFFELVSGGTTPGSERYTIFGLFKTGNGSAGEVNGQLTGTPDNGQFSGRLTRHHQRLHGRTRILRSVEQPAASMDGRRDAARLPGQPPEHPGTAAAQERPAATDDDSGAGAARASRRDDDDRPGAAHPGLRRVAIGRGIVGLNGVLVPVHGAAHWRHATVHLLPGTSATAAPGESGPLTTHVFNNTGTFLVTGIDHR